MKLNEIKAAPGFEDLIPKKSLEQQDDFGANLLMFKFLSRVEDVAKAKNLSRKKLAELIGTSASNITQLFRGQRLINLLTLSKLERVLDIEFEISISKQVSTTLNAFEVSEASYFAGQVHSLSHLSTTYGQGFFHAHPMSSKKQFIIQKQGKTQGIGYTTLQEA